MSHAIVAAQTFNFVIVQVPAAATGLSRLIIRCLLYVSDTVVIADAHNVHVCLFLVEHMRP